MTTCHTKAWCETVSGLLNQPMNERPWWTAFFATEVTYPYISHSIQIVSHVDIRLLDAAGQCQDTLDIFGRSVCNWNQLVWSRKLLMLLMLLGDLGGGDGQYVGFVTSPLTDCGGPGDHTLDISSHGMWPMTDDSQILWPCVSQKIWLDG